MDEHALRKEFKRQCISQGFLNLAPHYYARCIGDGIFQTIYTGFKQYLNVNSPCYDPQHRKDYYISIGVKSMYTRWPEWIFVPGKSCGGYSPANLLCMENYVFDGIRTEYVAMLEGGFSALNVLNTQKEMLQFRNSVMRTSRNTRIHSFDLVAPYLMCGEIEEAFFEIDHQYTHSVIGFFSENEQLLSAGKSAEFLVELDTLKVRTQEASDLWCALIGRNYDFVHAYLSQNYEQNYLWAQKYRIPFSEDFHKAKALL